MDSTTLAAIIGGVCTLSAPIITLIVKATIDRSRNPIITNARQKALNGTWTGTIEYDDTDDEPLAPHDAVLEVTSRRRFIEARVAYTTKGGSTTVKASGVFILDSLMRVEYKNEAPHVNHFGTLLLNLSPDAKTLSGRFVTYGRITGIISTGRVRFIK